MRSKFTLFLFLLLCAFTNREFSVFYNPYVEEVHAAVTKTKAQPQTLTPTQQFNNQFFSMWTSPVGSEEADLPAYYNQLLAFATNHNIRTIIWYIDHTSAEAAAFYDPASTDPNSFVQLLQAPATQFPVTTQIQLLFDCSSMNNLSTLYVPPGGSVAAGLTAPTSTVLPSAPYYFATFLNCLQLYVNLNAAVSDSQPFILPGVVLDPENNCTGTTPNPATAGDQQVLVNYMDEYVYRNYGTLQYMERGMTFGGDAKNQIFGDGVTLPITTDTYPVLYAAINAATATGLPDQLYKGDSTASGHDGLAPWRSSSQTDPYLQNIYPQLYNITNSGDPSYIYTLSSDPASAGYKMLQWLTETPYRPGTGSIAFTTSSAAVTGTGTNFLDLPDDSPLALIINQSTGEQKCLRDSSIPGTPSGIECASRVSGSPTSNTALTLVNPPAFNSSDYPTFAGDWLYVESLINYRQTNTGITLANAQNTANNIFLMFSAEGDFFGSWTLGEFMNFVESFYNNGQTFGLYYGPNNPPYASTGQGVLPLPNSFAIFTYEQMTGRATIPPPNVWFPGE